MALYRLAERQPQIDPSAFIAPGAHVVGTAVLHAQTSVWFSATIRADNDIISLGARSNVQEGAVLHTDPGLRLEVGEDVTIGHQAMLHGCTIGSGSLIGIQAVILNGAVIGEGSLVGAGALVTERKVFPPRSLIIGSPAKVVRQLSDEEVAGLLASAQAYVKRAQLFREGLQEL